MIFEVLSKICIFIIFLVSTLSKGNLAKQNYDVFKECYDKKIYPELIDETKTRKAVHITMLTTYGLKRNMYTDIIQNEVTLQNLFRKCNKPHSNHWSPTDSTDFHEFS